MLIRIYLFLAVVFWGWSFVATKILLDYVSPVELMALRFIIGLPALYAIVLANKVKLKFDRQHRWHVAFGSAIITAHFLIQITGIKYTSATNTGWIIAVTPLVMALLAFLILREKIK